MGNNSSTQQTISLTNNTLFHRLFLLLVAFSVSLPNVFRFTFDSHRFFICSAFRYAFSFQRRKNGFSSLCNAFLICPFRLAISPTDQDRRCGSERECACNSRMRAFCQTKRKRSAAFYFIQPFIRLRFLSFPNKQHRRFLMIVHCTASFFISFGFASPFVRSSCLTCNFFSSFASLSNTHFKSVCACWTRTTWCFVYSLRFHNNTFSWASACALVCA